MPARALLAALLAAALVAGCGGTPELSDADSRALASARERLDDAIDTAETVRTSRAEARRLLRQVRRFESSRAQVEQNAPSLVAGSDRRTTRDFVRYALSDPPRALRRPAAEEVGSIVRLLEAAGKDSKIAALDDISAERFLREVAGDIRPIWPDLARRLERARRDLG